MILGLVRDLRLKLGFTQLKLSHLSNVSLATIQNIEAGKTNPTIDIMEKLFCALGVSLSASYQEIDLELAALLGVPLVLEKLKKRQNFSKIEKLKVEGIKWAHQLESFDLRTYESVIAFYMAIKDEFPSFWKKYFGFQVLEDHIKRQRENGRVIKLRRIAISNLCEYL